RDAPPVPLGSGGQIPLAGQPVGLVAQVLAHAGEVVDDDNAGPWPLAGWRRHIGRHIAARGGELHLGHGVLLVVPSRDVARLLPTVTDQVARLASGLPPIGSRREGPGGAWWRPAAGAGPTGVTQPRQRNVARSAVCRLRPTWWAAGCPHPGWTPHPRRGKGSKTPNSTCRIPRRGKNLLPAAPHTRALPLRCHDGSRRRKAVSSISGVTNLVPNLALHVAGVTVLLIASLGRRLDPLLASHRGGPTMNRGARIIVGAAAAG